MEQQKISTEQTTKLINNTTNVLPKFNNLEKDKGPAETVTIEVNDEQTPEDPIAKGGSVYKGLLFAAAAGVCFSFLGVIVKYAENMEPTQLALLRSIGIFILSTPEVMYRKINVFPKGNRLYLLGWGTFGTANLVLRFYSFRYLSLAEASVIVLSNPVLVSIFALIFLKEPCGLFLILSIAFTFIGTVVITKLPLVISNEYSYNTEQIWGLVAALSSCLFSSGIFIFLRKLKNVHQSVVLFNFGCIVSVETMIIYIAMRTPWYWPTQREWALVACLSIASFAGQILLTLATKSENAGPVSVIRAAVDIVLVFIWQVTCFQENPDPWTISGAVIVTSSIIVISLRKWVSTLKEGSKAKKYFGWLTI